MIIGDVVELYDGGRVAQRTFCLVEGKLVIVTEVYDGSSEQRLSHSSESINSDVPMTPRRVREIIRQGLA